MHTLVPLGRNHDNIGPSGQNFLLNSDRKFKVAVKSALDQLRVPTFLVKVH